VKILIGTQENTDLNNKLEELTHKEEFTIPFHTFGWRSLDFDKPVRVGIEPYTFDDGQPYKQFIGLMAHSRHAYKSWITTDDQTKEIKRLCQELAKEGSVDSCNKLTEYLQTCKENIVNESN
jgi:hypothetical protein